MNVTDIRFSGQAIHGQLRFRRSPNEQEKKMQKMRRHRLPTFELISLRILSRFLPRSTRCFSTTSRIAETGAKICDKTSGDSSQRKPLTQAQQDFLSSALRVNQAGELAATLIYTAQTPPLVASHPHLRPLMKHMHDQEAGHFRTFNMLISKHRVRPTVMYPVWTLAASILGWGTAIMGRETAMACTEAVETEIGTHYNSQVRALLGMESELREQGEDLGPELKELIETIRRVRDEELEHLDCAVQNDAQQAVSHGLLTGVIRAGCRGAIWISERI